MRCEVACAPPLSRRSFAFSWSETLVESFCKNFGWKPLQFLHTFLLLLQSSLMCPHLRHPRQSAFDLANSLCSIIDIFKNCSHVSKSWALLHREQPQVWLPFYFQQQCFLLLHSPWQRCWLSECSSLYCSRIFLFCQNFLFPSFLSDLAIVTGLQAILASHGRNWQKTRREDRLIQLPIAQLYHDSPPHNPCWANGPLQDSKSLSCSEEVFESSSSFIHVL